MKSIIYVGTFLLAILAQASASGKTSVICENPLRSHQKIVLNSEFVHTEDEGATFLFGQLVDNYNGAALVCRNRGWDFLNRLNIPLLCTGVWNHAQNETGAADHTVNSKVSVVISKTQDGKYTAQYKNDSYEGSPGVKLECTVK